MGAASLANIPVDALVFASGEDASRELARPGWTPVFLSAPQNQLLLALGDAIIPATDTPGATAAYANRFLDLVLSVLPPETQREFLHSLAWFDSAAQAHYKSSFADLSAQQKDDLLNLVAWPQQRRPSNAAGLASDGHLHFETMKHWIASAYYTSPVGLKELGWDGWPARGVFKGCDHQPEQHPAPQAGAQPDAKSDAKSDKHSGETTVHNA